MILRCVSLADVDFNLNLTWIELLVLNMVIEINAEWAQKKEEMS